MFKFNIELGEWGGWRIKIMNATEKKDFKEFSDYIFLGENENFERFNETLYLKVLGKNDEYLGSTRIAILKDCSKTEIELLIEEVLSLKYPLYERYTIIQSLKK